MSATPRPVSVFVMDERKTDPPPWSKSGPTLRAIVELETIPVAFVSETMTPLPLFSSAAELATVRKEVPRSNVRVPNPPPPLCALVVRATARRVIDPAKLGIATAPVMAFPDSALSVSVTATLTALAGWARTPLLPLSSATMRAASSVPTATSRP